MASTAAWLVLVTGPGVLMAARVCAMLSPLNPLALRPVERCRARSFSERIRREQ